VPCAVGAAPARVRTAVDATNIEIFRDLLGMLPSSGDAVIDVAELELRVPEAATLLVETARILGEGRKLVLTVDRPAPPRA
jgi:hypothetical protein